jgi:N-methylhydantoinase A
LHREIFAFEDRGADIEFVNWRVRVACNLRREALGCVGEGEAGPSPAQKRRAWLAGGRLEVPVFGFQTLTPNRLLEGPAIVETAFTTIVVDSDSAFRLDPAGNLIVELNPCERREAA